MKGVEGIMKIIKGFLPLLLCMTAFLTACGKEPAEETAAPVAEPIEIVTDDQQKPDEAPDESVKEQEAGSDDTAGIISQEQAYKAVLNYCRATDPDFTDVTNSSGAAEYWDVSTNETGEIVVLYRSYTAAQTRYYIEPETGETYVTELVPGIIDEEQRTGETFNIRDYMEDVKQNDE